MKEILGYYNPILVTISFTIAAIASYTALDLAGRVTPKSRLRSRLIWSAGGAVAMGTGIWSMHFIAMLAFKLPIPVNYDVALTLLSWAVGIAASGVALLLFSRPKLSLSVMVGGSSVMGLAIASMHYLGMAAVKVTATVHYNPWRVALSVLVAIAASGAALWLAFRFRNSTETRFDWWKICSAIVMGIAISGMHYTGMWATCFMLLPDVEPVAEANSYWLGINIGIATLLILIGTLLTALFDRRYAAQLIKQSTLEQSEKRFRDLIEKMPVGVLLLDANGKIILGNQYVCELLKFAPDELRGKSVFKLNWQLLDESGKIIDFDRNPLKQALAEKQPVHNQLIGVARKSEPETLWLLLSVDPQFAADGSVERAVCTFNNISDRKQTEDEIRLLVETTQAISRSADVESALTIILRLICTSLGWDIGEAWMPSVDGTCLKYSSTWYGRENSFEEFRRHSETITFALGDGLPGRVWQSQQPELLEDLSATEDRMFPRREIAVKLGLKIGFAVPVVAGSKVLAVLVFLSTKTAVNGRSIDPVCTIAAQLGSLIGRKVAEAELMSVSQRLQHLLSATPAVIFSLKLGGNYELTFLSENIVSMIGYEAREFLDNSIVWDTVIYPEDREIVFTALANLLSKEFVSYECRIRHKDGSYRWVYDEVRLVKDSAGLPLECVGYGVDITARKQAELALQQQLKREQLVNLIQERIRSSLNLEEVLRTAVEEMRLFLSNDRTIIYRFNPDWSGFVSVESVADSALSILGTNIHDPCFGEQYARLYEQGRIRAIDNIYTAGITFCHVDFLKQFEIKANLVVPILPGEKIWGLLIAHHCQSPRQWESSEIESIRQISVQLAIAIQQCTLFEQAKTEIAERKLAESALQKAVLAADAANRAKSEFLASMSHELRTPLNAILGFSQLMVRDAALNSEQQQHLEIINRAGEHLLSLINDILEMSKIEAGRSKLNESNFNLYHLLKSLENMFSFQAESKGLQLTFELASGLPEFVKTDEGKLRQVLINILGNAIKFTSTGGATLRATVQESRKQDNFLCLLFEIEDTGPGIDKAEMDKLFEHFGQTQTGQKSKQGTGLGLPISRKFVQLMGGDITVSSTPGVGSTFSFDIVIKPGDLKIQMPQIQRQVIGLAANQPEYRILAVDDARDSRLFLVKLLSSIGFQVREAGNGQEAIAVWENWQPHLILMDMQMPLVDGYEATKQIKAHPLGKSTAIVALTASAFEEDRKEILAAGCDDFVRKPFQENTLFAKMEELLSVRYVYEEPINVKPDTKAELREVGSNQSVELQLCQIPPESVEKIYRAAKACSDDQIIQLIEEMPLEIGSAAQVITDLANNFLFDEIIELIKSVRSLQEEGKIFAPRL